MKTRDKLIEVARQLFDRQGMENTTISDIAEASKKGRRTIYTYFKNKLEIYNAVLSDEATAMVEHMQSIVDNPTLESPEKLRLFIIEHFKLRLRPRNAETLKNILRLDLGRIEKLRKLVASREELLLERILDEGIRRGEIRADRAREVRTFLVQMMLSMAVSVEARNDDPELWRALDGFATFISARTARE